ncbi:MAG: biopolymer transporter ExbD [Phycisphaerae bacterium]
MLIKSADSNDFLTIELTPLIDMVFLLLIFFLVATTFQQAEREMQVALPFAKSSGPISAALRELIVNVDEAGAIIVGGRTVSPEQLQSVVEDAVTANPKQKVTVRGDRTTAYENVVRALDVCKLAGIQEPYLDTVLE